ncbi:hypothetical protein HKD28_15080 [Gluconobacter sp. LMG 1744]|uniref:hypothetical protein n=1 Tax=Gluconobacter cadivus TaxID=2728101 RepID=UPI001884F4BE|nr:hypothetical protein [Gluconobacter cadivus]MBF0892714.1 hypothetical protein [Gluconobacter cadivus]
MSEEYESLLRMMEKLDKEAIRLNNILKAGTLAYCKDKAKESGREDYEILDELINEQFETCYQIEFLQYIRNEYERDNSYSILKAYLEGPDLMERVPQDWVTIIPRDWFFKKR